MVAKSFLVVVTTLDIQLGEDMKELQQWQLAATCGDEEGYHAREFGDCCSGDKRTMLWQWLGIMSDDNGGVKKDDGSVEKDDRGVCDDNEGFVGVKSVVSDDKGKYGKT